MNICKEHDFKNGNVKGFEMGFAPVGKPLMNVFFYLFDRILIDTGQSNMRKYFIELVKDKDIEAVLLTHHHEDHSGNARVVKEMKKVPVYGHPLTVEKLKSPFRILPYQSYTWGKTEPVEIEPFPDVINSEHFTFIPIHTPGHSKDHTVYLEQENGWLFAGDFFLGPRIKFFRADENINETIKSLEKVLKYDFDTIFCGLNPQQKNGKKMLQKKLEYLKEFYVKVKELMEKGHSEHEILKQTGKEERLIKTLTFGNVGRIHMVRSSIRGIKAEG